MASTKRISHELFASLWVALNSSQDLSRQIREFTGHYALESMFREELGHFSRPLVIYAIELTIVFDLIRTSTNSSSHQTKTGKSGKEQKFITSTLAYLIRQIEPQLIRDDAQGLACRNVLLRSIMSALCALYHLSAHSDVDQETGRHQVALAAQHLATSIPKEGDSFRFLRDVSWYLIAVYSKQYQGSRYYDDHILSSNVQALGRPNRSEIIERLIDIATDLSTNPIERVKAVIEIHYAYLESDAALIKCCPTNNNERDAASAPDSIQDLAVAVETRHLIQEHLMSASLEGKSEIWVQAIIPSLMSLPFMDRSCATDTCQCAFGAYQNYILGNRKQKSKFLRHSMQKVYSAENMGADLPDLLGAIVQRFEDRMGYAVDNGRTANLNDSEATTLRSASEPRTAKLSDHGGGKSSFSPPQMNLSPEQRTNGSSNLQRYYSRPGNGPLPGNSAPFSDSSTNKRFENNVPQSPPSLSDPGDLSSSQRSRNDSITTITSSREAGRGAFSEPVRGSELRQDSHESYKIVVEGPRSATTKSPHSREKSFPEVLAFNEASDSVSILSESSIPITVFSTTHSASRGRWGNFLRGKKDASTIFNVPKFRFFASGKHVILWTKYGGGIIDTSDAAGHDFIAVREADITHTAGGTSKFVVISRIAENYRLSIYSTATGEKVGGWDLPRNPGAIDFSPNDQYLAIKYTRSLHLYNLQQPGTIINHTLPNHDTNQPGAGNHLVSFASDSQSFIAATRFQPERVYTYWSLCTQSTTALQKIATSSAPFGHIEDHGLTSLVLCGPTSRNCPNAFLSTFTEKGFPVLLNMNHKGPIVRLLRDPKEQIGTRIHGSALTITDARNGKSDLVLINQSNQVFWVSDVFGTNSETRLVTTLKRAKSLKNEIQVAVSDVDEGSIFWVDKQTQRGVLIKVGKNGGKANPIYYRLDVEPLCGG